MRDSLPPTIHTGKSVPVTVCQICSYPDLFSIVFLGYLPPVNTMPLMGETPKEQPSYPANLLYCKKCHLVQLGLIVDPEILFPANYPYTSSTTKVLRDNFAQLYKEACKLISIRKNDLIIDIGSNDGNLLQNFKDNHKVLGVTPEEIGKIAMKKGIPTILSYFDKSVSKRIIREYGKAKIITLTNSFAHIEHVHQLVRNIKELLTPDGVFISESHYLPPLIKTVQYDTIYHEHLRYYSLHSLQYLLNLHGLEIFFAKEIPPHGGSIRVYAAKKNIYKVKNEVKQILQQEKKLVTNSNHFTQFKNDVVTSKLKLNHLLYGIKKRQQTIYGIGAPARGSTLINYVGLDSDILTCIVETKGSHKIGKYMPGTLIPVFDEEKLIKEQPDYALLLSWHIAKVLIPKLKEKGYKGRFIIPLPRPKIIA